MEPAHTSTLACEEESKARRSRARQSLRQIDAILQFGTANSYYGMRRETNTRPASASFIAGIKSLFINSFTT
jgi:hypothetical protein